MSNIYKLFKETFFSKISDISNLTNLHTYIYRNVYIYLHNVYIYIYVYIYINIYTYMHVYAIMKIICSPGYHDNKFVANSCTWAYYIYIYWELFRQKKTEVLLRHALLHADYVEPTKWLGFCLFYNWIMQSLKHLSATFLH